jgi:hypothetical protein
MLKISKKLAKLVEFTLEKQKFPNFLLKNQQNMSQKNTIDSNHYLL